MLTLLLLISVKTENGNIQNSLLPIGIYIDFDRFQIYQLRPEILAW